MSAAQNANQALSLVAKKVGHLLMRAQKLKESNLAAKALAYDIAITILVKMTLASEDTCCSRRQLDTSTRGHQHQHHQPVILSTSRPKFTAGSIDSDTEQQLGCRHAVHLSPHEKVEDVCTSCTWCHEKKTRCVCPLPQQKEALCAVVTLKKSKVAEKKTQATQKRKPSASQLKAWPTPGPGKRVTCSVSHRHPVPISPEITEDNEQDAEAAASNEDKAINQMLKAGVEDRAEGGVEGGVKGGVDDGAELEELAVGVDVGAKFEGQAAETPVDCHTSGGLIVDNDVDMDAPSIEALSIKFDTLFWNLADCVEAVESRVDTMETGNLTVFNPPADILVGSPYGQLPASWLLRVTNASHVGDSSISFMGRVLTTAWDESQALVQTAPRTSSISAVPVADEASSEQPCTPSSSVSMAE
ncbi:hypothetical protein EDD22DRAFT_844272 [Suillus occidentalis]|nr:hypothetical protein EDD22DRAFT_844272 [Suillus occidentalis]